MWVVRKMRKEGDEEGKEVKEMKREMWVVRKMRKEGKEVREMRKERDEEGGRCGW